MRARRDPAGPCLLGELVRIIEGVCSAVQRSADAAVAVAPRAIGQLTQFVNRVYPGLLLFSTVVHRLDGLVGWPLPR
jgi:hypothetical protein